eukprot:s636_g19.t1
MASDDPSVEKKQRRRTLVFADLLDKSYGEDRVLNGKDQVSEQDCLRTTAARAWEKEAGAFSNPRQLADDRWCCTAHCFRHERCAEGQERTFQFTGSWRKTVYCLSIGVAGECLGRPRRAGEARKFDKDEIHVDERLCILREVETLLEDGRPFTPSSVQMKFGNATQTFLESTKSFKDCVEGIDQNALQFRVLDAQSNSFHWVALLIARPPA